jgi:hypothetical protein
MKKFYFLLFLAFSFIANAQIVNIPDYEFKNFLLNHNPVIDTNNDNEIQVSEALAYTGSLNYLKYDVYNLVVEESQCSPLYDINNFQPYADCVSSINYGMWGYIYDLTGLEAFKNVSEISFEYVQLTNNGTVSVSNFPNLTKFIISFASSIFHEGQQDYNVDIDLSNNPNLMEVFIESYHQPNNINTMSLFSGNINLDNLNLTNSNNIEKLSVYFCHLSTIDVTDKPNLKTLKLHDNLNLTSLNTSNNANLLELHCTVNNTFLDVTQNTALKKLTCSSNSFTNLDVSQNSELETLSLTRNNQLTTLDLAQNLNLLSLNCNNNSQLSSLDVSQNSNLTYLSCYNNQLTSLNIKNGNVISSGNLNFSNNPNLQYICADDEEVDLVQQKINTYGYGSTCHVNSYCSFTPNGTFYDITGNTKFDFNNNGCDVVDINYPNLKISITDGTNSGTMIANTTGDYYIPVQAGNHTVTPVLENPTYFNISPANFTVDFSTQASPFTQDFCVTANGVHNDVEIMVMPTTPARPGFDADYKIVYKNKGNQVENGTVSLTFDDAVLDYIASNPVYNSNATNSFTWNYTNLQPFETRELIISFNVNSPMESPAVNNGDILDYSVAITTSNTEETPDDNIFELNQTVVGSFDPNDKTCLEGETVDVATVGKYVHYVIRFENTGTYPAQNIVVKDMIDISKFDVSTLVPLNGSHEFFTRIKDNKVEFIFENINLDFNDATNDGYVSFKIKTLPTLTVGETFSNDANIYWSQK